MTNSEVIKKISGYAGLAEPDSRLFFEVFIQRLFEEFKPGNSLRIDNIGFIYLKNIVSEVNGKEVKGIVFSESKEITKSSNIFFYSGKTATFYPDDFNFSLSLKKMEIPVGEEIDRTLFLPPTGNELLSFMDSKVDNLLNESEIFKAISNEDEKFIMPVMIPEMKVIESLEESPEFQPVFGEEKLIDPDKFQKINSLYSGFADEEDEIQNKPLNIKEKEITAEFEEEEKKDIRYKRVQYLSHIRQEELKPEIEREKITQAKESDNLLEKTPAVQEVPLEKIEPKETPKPISDKKIEKRSRKKVLVLVLFFLILISAAAYYFIIVKSPKVYNLQTLNKVPASDPVKINRSNEIPANYISQSNSRQEAGFDGIDPAVVSDNKNIESAQQINEPRIPTVENGAYKEYGDYIFSDGKIFFIQVSSWKSLSRAEEHSNELKAKGFNTSIEKVISSKGNVYYRVKLGNFNSLEEARDFLRKQQG